MKSREGTVVDADDLMDEMYATARNMTEELGKIDHFSADEKDELFKMISLGALKYYILKVDPKKTMLFNPEESIDFNGNTGPFIQYTHARICSLNRKAEEKGIRIIDNPAHNELLPKERDLLKLLFDFPGIVQEAGENYSPAVIANYCYDLAKEFNGFYQEIPVLKEEDLNTISFRLQLSEFVGRVIKTGMDLLGIDVPDRM
jgi:arginyl-tRNA synthetase